MCEPSERTEEANKRLTTRKRSICWANMRSICALIYLFFVAPSSSYTRTHACRFLRVLQYHNFTSVLWCTPRSTQTVITNHLSFDRCDVYFVHMRTSCPFGNVMHPLWPVWYSEIHAIFQPADAIALYCHPVEAVSYWCSSLSVEILFSPSHGPSRRTDSKRVQNWHCIRCSTHMSNSAASQPFLIVSMVSLSERGTR